MQGENLLKRLEEENFFSEDFAREILIQLCDGLKELHEHNIIHRDIKPSNLRLQGDRIRLIDFDASRIFKAGKEEDTNLLGTQGYAPLEQYGSGQTDPRSDIYSLGVTLKNLFGEGYNGRLKKILDKCTEYDPARRFQSVDELKRAVRFEKFLHWGKIFAAVFIAANIFVQMISINEAPAPVEKNIAEEIPVSVGGLKLGDSVETVKKFFGKENEIRISEDLPGSNFYEYKDLIVTVKDNFVTGIATYTDAVKDNRGIRRGDPLEKIFEAYGAEGWQVDSEDGEIFYEYPFDSASGNFVVMRFAIKNNVVEYMSLRLDR